MGTYYARPLPELMIAARGSKQLILQNRLRPPDKVTDSIIDKDAVKKWSRLVQQQTMNRGIAAVHIVVQYRYHRTEVPARRLSTVLYHHSY
jgi:hypothetical protein